MYAIVLVLTILGTALIAAFVSSSAVRYETEAQNSSLLSQAKQALIGWALSRTAGADRPGDLPAPDAISDSNYDGYTNTGCMDASKANGLPLILTGTNIRCLGRLPWASLKMAISLPSQEDTQGMMPWYAVSANLTHLDTCLTLLNSDTANWPYASYVCGSGTNLPYPWLTVRDSRGNILSNRVAFVVIVPGQTLTGQQRPLSPNLAGPSQYLDTVTVASGCTAPCVPGTYSNSDFDNDFIMGDPSDSFNDRLIYVTIDDLMTEVEKRVAAEIRGIVSEFSTKLSEAPPAPRYFWLAAFNPSGTATPLSATVGTARGMLPSLPAPTLSNSFQTAFQWSLTGSVSRSGTVTTAEVRDYSVAQAYGSCVWGTTNPLRNVDCSATIPNPKAGVDQRTITLSYTGSSSTYTVSTDPTSSNLVISPATATLPTTRSVNRTTLSSVSLSINDCTYNWVWQWWSGWSWVCSSVGTGTETAGSGNNIRTWNIAVYPETADAAGPYLTTKSIPAWYFANNWQQLTYIAIAPGYNPGAANSCAAANSCFAVTLNGSNAATNVQSVVMMAGRRLDNTDYLALAGLPDPPQIRPDTNLYNYFDSSNNQLSTTLIFDRKTPLSTTFNDQVVVIAP